MCEHKRQLSFSCKSSDLNSLSVYENNILIADHSGYVPVDIGIGGGDYVEFEYCLDCGQILKEDFPKYPDTTKFTHYN